MAILIKRPAEHAATASPIELVGVSQQYDGRYALREVSFSLQAEESVAVVGPNGAGKTTLFKIISGVMQPDKGTVTVYGECPGGHVCIAYVPQRSQVDWKFPVTVAEVVMMGRIRKLGFLHWPKRRDWALVREALQRVGMDDLADRQIGELSGGQQQRVFLAQAMAQEAEIILLDEPLAGLDLPSQETIFAVLEDLKREGAAIMVATHDLDLAGKRFEKMMLLNRRLIAFGTPEEVLNKENLLQAFSGRVHLIGGEEGGVMVADTCCGGEEEHQHG